MKIPTEQQIKQMSQEKLEKNLTDLKKEKERLLELLNKEEKE